MIKKVTIENLRGIRKGELDQLSPVSVLVGPNNSGKSTCLEAIEIVGVGNDVSRLKQCVARRGIPSGWEASFAHHRGAGTAVVVTGDRSLASLFDTREEVNQRLLAAGFILQGSWHTPFGALTLGRSRDGTWTRAGLDVRLVDVGAVRVPRALEDAYTEIDRAGRLRAVVAALAASMPSLEDLRILKQGEDFVLHTFLKDGERVPTYLSGDGFKRLLELAAALADRSDGVALLEEPECYQHPRYLRELVGLIRQAVVANRTQVILSTHSLELIDELLHGEWPAEAVFPTMHRLRLVDGQLKATALTREQAIAARDDLAEDLRS